MTQSSAHDGVKIETWRQTRASSSGSSSSPSSSSLPSSYVSPFAALLAMRSWRCRFSAHRESKRTAFRLLQHNEKSSVPLKEACMRRIDDAAKRVRRAFRRIDRAHRRDATTATCCEFIAIAKNTMKQGIPARRAFLGRCDQQQNWRAVAADFSRADDTAAHRRLRGKNFAQVASRSRVGRTESIKNERIASH